jgi:DNA-binding transcriptional regulator YiaG
MTLETFLVIRGISTAQFAKTSGYPFATVAKWRQRIRIPRPAAMLKIQKLTKGKVKPHDWYR